MHLFTMVLLLAGGVAGAEEGAHEEAEVCTAAASEEACEAYWEHHINWWSWDYKAGTDQAREHRHMPPPFGFALINFAIFAAILYRLAAKPITEFLQTRHTTIKRDLDEAAVLRRQAETRLQEYDQKIARMDEELADLIAQVRREAEVEKQRIIAHAEEEARRLRAEAEAQIQAEVARARALLKRELVEAAVTAARATLVDQFSAEDQKRLSSRYLAELEGPPTASAARA